MRAVEFYELMRLTGFIQASVEDFSIIEKYIILARKDIKELRGVFGNLVFVQHG